MLDGGRSPEVPHVRGASLYRDQMHDGEPSEDPEQRLRVALRAIAVELDLAQHDLAALFHNAGINTASDCARGWALDQVMYLALLAESNYAAAAGDLADAHDKLSMAEFYQSRDPDGWVKYVAHDTPDGDGR